MSPSATPGVPAPNSTLQDRITWAETRALIRSDLDRIALHLNQPHSFTHRAYFFLLPGMQALFWHRISRTLLLKGWARLARLISLFALYLTRAEVPPTTSCWPSAPRCSARCTWATAPRWARARW